MDVTCSACDTPAEITDPAEGEDGWLYENREEMVLDKVTYSDGTQEERERKLSVLVARHCLWLCEHCGTTNTITEVGTADQDREGTDA